MAGSFKRKLDTIVDNMDVIVPDMEEDYNKFGKKFKIDATHHINLGWPIEWKNGKGSDTGISESSDFACDAMEYADSAAGRCQRKPMYPSDIDSDVPSTHEVIDSLRKVKLWLSAQEENNDYHIQHISNVQDYALSKQQAYHHQRKITHYLIRNQ